MNTVLYPSPMGPVLSYPNSPSPYIAAVVFETLLYGIYLVLFCICIVTLARKQHVQWLLLLSAIIMFALATADIGFTYDLLFQKLLRESKITYDNLRPKYILYVTNNLIGDMLLLYRCYQVWSSKKRIIVLPALLLAAATVCGFIFEGTTLLLSRYSWIHLSLNVMLNVILTTMAAGRIWWASRSAGRFLGQDVSKRYHLTVAIIVESGIIYSIYATLDLFFRSNTTVNIILDAGLIQVVGIVPTLIIVQVRSGQRASTDDINMTPLPTRTPAQLVATDSSLAVAAFPGAIDRPDINLYTIGSSQACTSTLC